MFYSRFPHPETSEPSAAPPRLRLWPFLSRWLHWWSVSAFVSGAFHWQFFTVTSHFLPSSTHHPQFTMLIEMPTTFFRTNDFLTYVMQRWIDLKARPLSQSLGVSAAPDTPHRPHFFSKQFQNIFRPTSPPFSPSLHFQSNHSIFDNG